MLARHCNTHRTQDFTAQILHQPCTHNMVPAEQSFKQRASCRVSRLACRAAYPGRMSGVFAVSRALYGKPNGGGLKRARAEAAAAAPTLPQTPHAALLPLPQRLLLLLSRCRCCVCCSFSLRRSLPLLLRSSPTAPLSLPLLYVALPSLGSPSVLVWLVRSRLLTPYAGGARVVRSRARSLVVSFLCVVMSAASSSSSSGGKPAYDYLIKLLLIGDSGTCCCRRHRCGVLGVSSSSSSQR